MPALGSESRQVKPFHFMSSLNLTLLTNRRARDLAELLEHLRVVPGSVIYYHTHHFLVQHQYLSPEPPNDFAYWVTNGLQEDRLGEQLAAIDLVQFRTIRALRERIIEVIETYLNECKQLRTAPEGEEFHFREAVSFIVPTTARRPRPAASSPTAWSGSASARCHFISSTRACAWSGAKTTFPSGASLLGEHELAQAIARLDPYTYTLDGLRKEVVRLVRRRLQEMHA